MKKALAVMIVMIGCFISQNAHGRAIIIGTPEPCVVFDRVENDKVYIISGKEDCSDKVASIQVNVPDNIQKVEIFFNGQPWKREVPTVTTEDIKNLLARSQKDSATMQIPTNIHTEEAVKKANGVASLYQSEAFQNKIKKEGDRAYNELFKKDLEKHYPDSTKIAKQGKLGPNERIYVFVSSSMPKETLRQYAKEIAELRDPNIRIAMRGFIGGPKYVKPTYQFVRDVLVIDQSCKEARCPLYSTRINIDPQLFARYNIDKVPSFVYVPSITVKDKEKSEGSPNNSDLSVFHAIHGDIKFGYALERFGKESKSKGVEKLLAAHRKSFYNN